MTNNESPRKLKPQLRPGQYALPGGVPEAGPLQPTDFARDLRQPTRAPEVTARPPPGPGPGPAPAAAAPPPQLQAAPKSPLRPNQFAIPGGIPEAGPADFTHAEAAARKANLGRSNFVSPGYADHFAPENPAATATKQAGKFGQGARFMGKLGGTAVGAGMEGHSIYKVAKDPKATGIDVTTQAFEGVSKLAGTTAGGLAGTAMAGPVGGLIGGAVGYFAPELATKGLRKVFGQDTSSPIDRTNAREQTLRTQVRPKPAPAAEPAQAKRGPFTESFEKKMEALPRTQFLRAGSKEANAASAKMDSGEYLPGSGQGMVRSGNGNVTMMNTGAPPPPPSADYLRRQYAPTVYNDEGASWKHPATEPKPTSMVGELMQIRKERLAKDRAITTRGQDMTYAATLRGQDIGSADSRYGHNVNAETSRYGHDLTASNARARMGYDIKKDLRDFAISSRAADDAHLKSTQEAAANVYKNKFFKPGKDGVDVPDERAEKRAYDISNQLSKGAFGLRAREDQSLLQQDTQELTNMFMQMETPRKTGGDYFLNKIGMAENAQTLSAMPNFNGGTIKLLGANWNAGTGKNDYELTDADGRTHYMSNMSERQRELLHEMGIKPFDPRVNN